MEIIYGKKGSGKTTKLIQLVKESGGVLVVSDISRKRYLIDHGVLTKDQVISLPEVRNCPNFSFRNQPYYIDAIDHILWVMFGRECSGISMDPFHAFECTFGE